MKPEQFTIFLDRDGVINKDSSEYIKKPSEFEFIDKSPEAVALLCRAGFQVIIITNQSMIGRKMADTETLEAIFTKMKKGIHRAGGTITDIFFCPHVPQDNCSCRKPAPGLILAASQKYSISLEHSCMVGDSAKDIECAKNAGCAKTVLVQTGNGHAAAEILAEKQIEPDFTAPDLYRAALWIIENIR